jgi:hypothetical protein
MSLLEPSSLQSLFVTARLEGSDLGTATAFVVAHQGSFWLVTNWHVAAGRNPVDGQPCHPSGATPDRLVVMHNRPEVGHWTTATYPLLDPDGAPRWLEHPVFGRRVDVVALPLEEREEICLYPYTLVHGQAGAVLTGHVASDVHIVGFPFGLAASGSLALWSRGSIASEPSVDFSDRPCFLVDSRTRPGQSGSPVIALAGGVHGEGFVSSRAFGLGPRSRLLGVYSGRVNEQSDLGFVWKTTALIDIVERGRTGNGGLRDEPAHQ